MELLGIWSKNTFYNTLNDLVNWWFVKYIQKSNNQNTATIISICYKSADSKIKSALDTANIQQIYSTEVSGENIDKQINNKTIKHTIIFSDAVEKKIQEFIDYRKQSRKKMTDKAIELLRKDLKKRWLPDSVLIRQIETSIMRWYVWVFKPNEKEIEKILPNKIDWYYENVRSKLDRLTPNPWWQQSDEWMEVVNNAKAQYGEQFFLDAKTAYVKHQNSI